MNLFQKVATGFTVLTVFASQAFAAVPDEVKAAFDEAKTSGKEYAAYALGVVAIVTLAWVGVKWAKKGINKL